MDICIPNSENDVFFCYLTDDDYVILNSKNEELFKNYNNVEVLKTSESDSDYEKFVLKFEKSGKYGLINFNGEIVLDAEYDNIQSLKNRPGEILLKKNSKYGVLQSNGEIKIDIKYDFISGDEYYTENDGYAKSGYIVGEKTSNGYKYGHLNNAGEKTLDIDFESITRVKKQNDNNNYLIVMNNGKKGVYKNGNEVIKQSYQSIIYAESLDVFIVKRNSKYGVFSSSGKEILDVQYTSAAVAGAYISAESPDGDKKFYDINGNEVSNSGFVNIQKTDINGCYIGIDGNGYYSIISRNETISNNYMYISYAFNNYFILKNEEGYYGILYLYIGTVVEPEYSFMLVIDGKNAIEAEMQDGTVHIYSKELKKTVSMSNAIIETINENYTKIYSLSDIEYIDKNGEIVKSTDVYKDSKIYGYSSGDKWGYKDSQGNIVIEAEYDFVTELNDYGFAGILKDGKWGIVDEKGKIISEPTYEIETYYSPNFVGKYLLEILDGSYYCLELE